MATIVQCDRCRAQGDRSSIFLYRFGVAVEGAQQMVEKPASDIDLCSTCRRHLVDWLKPLAISVERKPS